jgi:predicted HicB family RNase H-like nuclease
MKTFPLKLVQDLHTRIKLAATVKGQTIGEWILEAIEEKLGRTG